MHNEIQKTWMPKCSHHGIVMETAHANFFTIHTITSPTPQNSATDKDNRDSVFHFLCKVNFWFTWKSTYFKNLEKASDYP